MKRSLPLIMSMVWPLFLLGYLLIDYYRPEKVKNTSAAHEVTPYLLLQVILAYERNAGLGNYTAFVVTMEGTAVQSVKANFSVSYVHDLIGHRTPRTSLELGFSRPYNLLRRKTGWNL